MFANPPGAAVPRGRLTQPYLGPCVLLTVLGLGCGGEAPEGAAVAVSDVAPIEQGREMFAEAAGGVRLYMEVVGEGAPIVVVHGGPGMDSRYLRRGLAALADYGQAVFYDQRGTGKSEGPLDSEHLTFLQFVDDIDAVREALAVERVSLLGHSFGGRLVMEYALRYPERIDRVVLVNTTEPGGRFIQEANERRASRVTEEDQAALEVVGQSGRLQTGDTVAFREFYEAAFRSTFSNPELLSRLDLSIQPMTAENGLRVISDVGGSVGEAAGWDRMREIRAPTLVLQGEDDLLPVRMVSELADSLSAGELALVPGAGHFPWVEAPEAFFAALSAWWDSPP